MPQDQQRQQGPAPDPVVPHSSFSDLPTAPAYEPDRELIGYIEKGQKPPLPQDQPPSDSSVVSDLGDSSSGALLRARPGQASCSPGGAPSPRDNDPGPPGEARSR